MKWTLEGLMQYCGTVSREVSPGVYVPARPKRGPLVWRARAALAVLQGETNAFTWPHGQ